MRRERILGGITLLLVLSAVGVSACGRPSATHVSDPLTDSFITIPEGWQTLTHDQLNAQGGANPFEAMGNPVLFSMIIAPDLDAGLASLSGGLDPEVPVVYAVVFGLSEAEQDSVSLRSTRNRIFPVDQWLADDPSSVTVFGETPLTVEGGYRGQRIVYSHRTTTEPTQQYGHSVTVDQTTYLDPSYQRQYFLIAFCTSDCYLENQTVLDQIVESWSVSRI